VAPVRALPLAGSGTAFDCSRKTNWRLLLPTFVRVAMVIGTLDGTACWLLCCLMRAQVHASLMVSRCIIVGTYAGVVMLAIEVSCYLCLSSDCRPLDAGRRYRSP